MAEVREKIKSSDTSTDVRCRRVQYFLEESDYLGKHKVPELEWKDYCPEIFRKLQEQENITSANYRMLLCARDILREVSSPGKPGRLITLSTDDRFMIKILRKSEMKVILETLEKYHAHLTNNKSTLLGRIYGLHSVKQLGGLKVYFFTFVNPIPLDVNINSIYHLKGSSRGPEVQKLRVVDYVMHKELNFDYFFHLNPLVRGKLLMQIKADCDFLEAEAITEYSLLIGLAKQASCTSSINSRSCHTSSASASPVASSIHGLTTSANSLLDLDQLSFAGGCQDPDSGSLVRRYGRQLPARAVRTKMTETGVQQQESHNVMLYFEIVDFYRKFRMMKRIEHLYKSLQSISVTNPRDYSSRFQDFLEQIFLADDSIDSGTCKRNSD